MSCWHGKEGTFGERMACEDLVDERAAGGRIAAQPDGSTTRLTLLLISALSFHITHTSNLTLGNACRPPRDPRSTAAAPRRRATCRTRRTITRRPHLRPSFALHAPRRAFDTRARAPPRPRAMARACTPSARPARERGRGAAWRVPRRPVPRSRLVWAAARPRLRRLESQA